jgi:hypothetical protein
MMKSMICVATRSGQPRNGAGNFPVKMKLKSHFARRLLIPALAIICAVLSAAFAQAAVWNTNYPMSAARSYHTATLLPNGKVLVAGGQNSSGVANSAELFDPATGKWTSTGAMTTSRSYHTATLLPNGKVLVAGGATQTGFSSITASAELYDPTTGTWTSTGTMTTARGYHVAVLLANGKVLVAGGGINNAAVITSASEIYDPATGTWTPANAMTSPRAGFAGVLLTNGKVLVAGGQSVINTAVASAEVFNPATSSWTATGTLSTSRSDLTMTVLGNGSVLAAGGWAGSGNNTTEPAITELYDPIGGTWTPTGSLNTARFTQTAALLQSGQVLVAGGQNESSGVLSSAELYNPSSGTWANTAVLNTGRYQYSATLLTSEQVLVAGGQNGGAYLSSSELYVPDNWVTVAITNITSAMLVSNALFTVMGTANASAPVASVFYSLNNTAWSIAIGKTNWSGQLTLMPGTNVVAVYAVDTSGNRSVTNSVNFDFVVTNQLLIRAYGLGTLSPNYSNAWLKIGQNYSITSAPATGFIFTNWTVSTNWIGGAVVTGTNLQFTMASNLTILATFAEAGRPTNTITAPANNQHMTNALAYVAGTVGDIWGVSNVWCQLNSNAWSLVTTTNGYTNWTTTFTLVLGTNTINAYAMNLGGNYSLTNTVSIVSSNTFNLQLSFTNSQPLKTNGLTFSLHLSAGLNGHIQVSTNLTSWTTLTNFVGTNSTITLLDPAATNTTRRFYRAMIP